ncbi:MAG TPA: nucleotide sugar dehydrogenase [Candidatus Paceibacterota bacterium]|nr:nucleotide sugar dehydrogenase [Candidatus Paceibacterota bacterium]
MRTTRTKTTPTRARERRRVLHDRKVAVIGLGYVGLPLALLAESRGYAVRGFDSSPEKVSLLRERRAEYLSGEEVRLFRKSKMRIRADEQVLTGADVYIICVPTPVHDDRTPDLEPLRSAAEAVGRRLAPGALVVVESTVSPGVCETIALSELERASGLRGGADFSFAHCPERVNPGDRQWSVRTIPRVLGGIDEQSVKRAERLYSKITDAPIKIMASIKEAEAVKMVENAFRDINIAFVNELAMAFEHAGIDVTNVIDGASTKPFGFMAHYPGCGVGGHCIPVDPYYLIRYGRDNGFEHRFLAIAREINSNMPIFTADLLERALGEEGRPLRGATVALLGLSYKRDIPDLRESPALEIQHELERRGALVRTFDPYVTNDRSASSLIKALQGATAAVVATDHTAFRKLTPNSFSKRGVRFVVDGRNCLSKEQFLAEGLIYRGIGR